jgi:hypothetical protein
MRLAVLATARRHAATLAILTIGVMGCAGSTAAQTTPAPNPATTPPARLPPVLQAVLAEALEKEKEEWRGPARLAPRGAIFPLPTCMFEHSYCGAINRDGTIAVAPRFDFVDNFYEGRAVVRLAGRYGYVDTDGNVIVEPQYMIAGRYRLGLAEVDVDGKSALIDLAGRQVLAPRFTRASPFTRDVFWVSEGVREARGRLGGELFDEMPSSRGPVGTVFVKGKWGLIDRSGAWIRQPEFVGVEVFDRDNNGLMWADAVGGWGLIRPDGTWLIEPTFEGVKPTSDGLAAVWRGGKTGYVDRTGTLVVPLKFDGAALARDYVAGLPAPAKLRGKVGLIDRSGNWVIEPIYDSIYPWFGRQTASKSRQAFKGFYASRDAKYGILDRTGNVLIDLQLERLRQPPQRNARGGWTFIVDMFPLVCADGHIIGLIDQKPRVFAGDGRPLNPPQGEFSFPISCEDPYVVKIGERFGYVDRALRPFTEAKFEQAGRFRHGFATVKLDGKYGLLRPDAGWALEPAFDAIEPLSHDKALVKAGRRASIVDLASGALIGARFDEVCSLGRGLVGVMVGGAMGAVDEGGNWLFQPIYEPWRFTFKEELVPVRQDGKWGFIDWVGNVIPASFDEVSAFDRGISWVKKDGAWCPIDRRGNTVSALGCQAAEPRHIKRPRPEHTLACRIYH